MSLASISVTVPAAPQPHPDHALFTRVRANDESAFAELFAAHYQALCQFATTFVHSADVAQELVQDVFFRVWEQRSAIDIHGSVRAYLFSATRNGAINFLKRERLEYRFFETATAEHRIPAHSARQQSDASLYYNEVVAAFDAIVQALPEGQRTVLALRWHHQLSHSEIADVLGISVKGVETQLGRAFKVVRAKLAAFR